MSATVVVVGPTAVGKSALALRLARRFDGDIVTADSRQVYRYMDIGTAKPSLSERAEVRHWMIDLVEPSEVYTAGRFRDEASRVLKRLGAERRPAFVTGGTGFYIRALLADLPMPEVQPNPAIRERLREQARTFGPEFLWSRLREVDPASAGRIHPRNLPRTIRALEIVETLGGPVPLHSECRETPDVLYIGLTTDRQRLGAVADARVLAQMDAGLLQETQLLLEMGYDPDSPALSGFGYREIISHLRGERTLVEAVGAYQRSTRQYIRRQMTWFRREPEIEWYDVQQAPEDAIEARVKSWVEPGLAS